MKALLPLLAGFGLLVASAYADAVSIVQGLDHIGRENTQVTDGTVTPLSKLQRKALASPGDLDPFDAGIVGDSVQASVLQPDGKIIFAGDFASVLGQPRSNIARLNSD